MKYDVERLRELRDEAISVLAEIMRTSRVERNRLDAARILLTVLASLEAKAPSEAFRVIEGALQKVGRMYVTTTGSSSS